MHFSRKGVYVAAALLCVAGGAPLWALSSGSTDVAHGPVKWLPDHDWSGQVMCRYPVHNRSKTARLAQSASQVSIRSEVEPNDTFIEAQVLTIDPGPIAPVDLDVKGVIGQGDDVDLYRITVKKGDVYGLAVISQSAMDPVLAIQQMNEISLVENDNHNGKAAMYPAGSFMPAAVGLYDSELNWIAPADGDYLIRVSSFASASRGDYTLQIRARRPAVESGDLGATQIIFLDFDGATINAEQLFGYGGRTMATLSPMRDFLTGWGLTAQDEAAVVQAIVSVVQDRFDALRMASLNGDLQTDKTAGHYDVQILNSRDHADPWGQPNVSRVIVGGTFDQLGILTLGIAQSIDPGNFDRQETAVVLLDLLSYPANDPWGAGNSVNAIGLASGLTIFDAIGQTVGNIVVHEAGHYLGNWHTDNENEIASIMDTGGRPIWYGAGAGDDATLGTPDDQTIEFSTDAFDPYEGVAVGEEETQVNTAFGMSTGRVQRESTPETPTWPYPLTSVRASPTTGAPPLRVEFAAGAIDNDAKDMIFTWDFTDGSPLATGPVVSHVFETPGQFLVKVTAANNQGLRGQATILITVSATLPTANLVVNPMRGAAPLLVSFDGSGSTAPAGNIIKYEWEFGDGATASGAQVQHTYTTQGYNAAKLTVTDSYGGTSTASALIAVNAPLEVYDTAQTIPTTQTAAPQCGLGSSVTVISSLTGLLLLMGIRRRY